MEVNLVLSLSLRRLDLNTGNVYKQLMLLLKNHGIQFWFFLLLVGGNGLFAQVESSDTSEVDLVIIDKADKIEKLPGEAEILLLTGQVELHQDSLLMYCDTARKENNELFARGNIILQQWDSINVFADTLRYYGDSKDAYLLGSVILQNDAQKLYTESLHYNTASQIAIYEDGATITDDTTFLYSKRGTYFVGLDEVFFKDSIYIKSKTFELYTDSMIFNTELQMATFVSPTRIDLDNGSKIYCEAGYFDIANNEALFRQNAQYVKEDQQALGDSIFYFGDSSEVVLLGNASLIETGKKASADKIIYNEKTEVLDLIGDAFFEDSIRKMTSEEMRYDLAADKVYTDQRSTLDNPPQFLEADTIDFDNASGLGRASGNIIWRDTSSDYTIFSQQAHYVDSTGYLKAYGGRPLLINQIDEDSFFLAADTLVSFEEVVDEDSLRQFLAYHDVRIYKSDLQALCDSLTYSSRDSIFHLFDDPIIWSDTSQFVADSLQIKLKDNQIDQIYLNQNAFILNSADEILFNQMRGKQITAYFKEGEIDRMLIKGNAMSIYYALDDFQAYIGANDTQCSSMLLRFGNNSINDIVFYDNPKAVFHPIQDINPEELKLEGFNWRISERPKSVQELSVQWQR